MKVKKGIILSAGHGSRLHPLTEYTNKQLLPVYDKPQIYYPISTLMQAGIQDILIITSPKDLYILKNTLKNGQQYGINISYRVQETPKGLADAFLIGEDFIGNQAVCLILGDNIFYGDKFQEVFNTACQKVDGAHLFGIEVDDPMRFGVATLDKNRVTKIIEKPKNPSSNVAVTGLYIYDNKACEYAKQLVPSARGELEITDLNNCYLQNSKVALSKLDNSIWFDIGTPNSLSIAAKAIEREQLKSKNKIGCIEEIAYQQGYISITQLIGIIETIPNCEYKDYLQEIITNQIVGGSCAG